MGFFGTGGELSGKGLGPPYEIGGKLNEVKQGGIPAGRRPPLSRYASLPPVPQGGYCPNSIPLLT
jgi:hypothetical protein